MVRRELGVNHIDAASESRDLLLSGRDARDVVRQRFLCGGRGEQPFAGDGCCTLRGCTKKLLLVAGQAGVPPLSRTRCC
jgi:hypothetical protein